MIDLSSIDSVLEQLRIFLTRLLRLTENARLTDLFAMDTQNWVALGRGAGHNNHDPGPCRAAISRFFDVGLADVRFVIEQCTRANSEWAKNTKVGRDEQLAGLKRESKSCA